jgi:hypothetical protein
MTAIRSVVNLPPAAPHALHASSSSASGCYLFLVSPTIPRGRQLTACLVSALDSASSEQTESLFSASRDESQGIIYRRQGMILNSAWDTPP